MAHKPEHRRLCFARTLLACCVLATCLLLCGCLGLSEKSTPAAKVDDSVVLESEVTSYIEGFRKSDQTRETDTGWIKWLNSNNFTAESLRTYVLEQVFIPKAVIRYQAKAYSLEVTEDELDKLVEKEKTYYVERSGQSSWDSVLAAYGYDESRWRSNEEDRLLEERLKKTVIGDIAPTESQVKTYGVDYASKYNGKHSYFIAFDSLETAQAALDRLGGERALVKVKEFKRLGRKYAKQAREGSEGSGDAEQNAQEAEGATDGDASEFSYSQIDGAVNAGWGSLDSSVVSSNTVYANALNDVETGTVSSVVDMGNGKFVLIFCDKSYVADSEEVLNLKKTPKPILKQIESDVADKLEGEAFEEWLEKATEESTVIIYDMPDDLSYNVNESVE